MSTLQMQYVVTLKLEGWDDKTVIDHDILRNTLFTAIHSSCNNGWMSLAVKEGTGRIVCEDVLYETDIVED